MSLVATHQVQYAENSCILPPSFAAACSKVIYNLGTDVCLVHEAI